MTLISQQFSFGRLLTMFALLVAFLALPVLFGGSKAHASSGHSDSHSYSNHNNNWNDWNRGNDWNDKNNYCRGNWNSNNRNYNSWDDWDGWNNDWSDWNNCGSSNYRTISYHNNNRYDKDNRRHYDCD